MDSHLKYFFALFFIFAVGAAALETFMTKTSHLSKSSNEFIVGFPSKKPASAYDPARIRFADEYLFLLNIYSPLIQYAQDGTLVSGLAERFYWRGSEARFVMRPNAYTIDGQLINAYDAEISLKRLMILGGNTHGNLKDMICPGVELKSLNESCPNMHVEDDGHILSIHLKRRMPFLFPMLTAIDFGVIPRRAIDPKTLAIRDYRNTSGPYYVSRDSQKGFIELAANPRNFNYSPTMPQKILFRPSGLKDPTESLRLLTRGEIDGTTLADPATIEMQAQFAALHKNVKLYSTLPIKLSYMAFTKRGLRRLSTAERIAIGKTVKNIFLSIHSQTQLYAPTEQIFPALGDGSLSEEQLKVINKQVGAASDAAIISKRLVAWNIVREMVDREVTPQVKELLPNAMFLPIHKIPGLVNYKKDGLQEPDFYLSSGDMSFLEDIDLLSYWLKTDFFYLRGDSAERWLHRYVRTTDDKMRMKLLREMHFKTLQEGAVVPFSFSPYTMLIRMPWQIHMSKTRADIPLWWIYH